MLTITQAADLHAYVSRAQESVVSGSPQRTQALLVELATAISELTDFSELPEVDAA